MACGIRTTPPVSQTAIKINILLQLFFSVTATSGWRSQTLHCKWHKHTYEYICTHMYNSLRFLHFLNSLLKVKQFTKSTPIKYTKMFVYRYVHMYKKCIFYFISDFFWWKIFVNKNRSAVFERGQIIKIVYGYTYVYTYMNKYIDIYI